MDGIASIIIFGVILILVGILTTPLDHPFGTAAFWIGIVITAIGVVALFKT